MICFLLIIIFLSFGIWHFWQFNVPDTTTEEVVLEEEEKQRTIYLKSDKDLRLLEKYESYNEDVVGLIQIEDTVLNHPMMQTPLDEEYYLYKDLDKK